MKLTKILLWITYIGFVLSLIAFGAIGVFFLNKDFHIQEAEKSNLEGVTNKSVTSTFSLPLNLDVEYYLRIREGELLVNGYFLKIQKKLLTDSELHENLKKEADFPKKLEGDLYSMPESDTYVYVSIPFASIETSVIIMKCFFTLVFCFLCIAIFLMIKFLQNCTERKYFISENSVYLRSISYLALGYSLISYVSQWLISRSLSHSLQEFSPVDLKSTLEFDWNYLMVSLFLVLIAQVFSEGVKMKEEQDLTI
jgi:hypothetical protein